MKTLFLFIFMVALIPFASHAAEMKDNEVIPRLAMAAAKMDKPVKNNKETDDENAQQPAEESGADDEEEPRELKSYIGDMETITAEFEDTLLELGREYNLGYVEMVAANPGVDPWIPGDGTKIILPKRHLLPNVPREGIVINLAEMRMYDFVSDPDNPKTYPLGIGREGLDTPLGQTKIVRKMEGPTWRPTPRMREEDPDLPAVVPPGEDNPLGTHALYLGWPQYLIHGTHKPLGVGRRVSSGCIRMYPEDIVTVFGEIPVGTMVTVIKEPIKFGWIDDMLYMEAHAEDELADSLEDIGKIKEYRVPETLFAAVTNKAGEHKDRLDWKKIRDAVKTRSGIPVPILSDKLDEDAVNISEEILTIDPEADVEADNTQDDPSVSPQRFNLNS